MSSASTQAGAPQKCQPPTINLLCRFASNAQAFRKAVSEIFPTLYDHVQVNFHECSLAKLPAVVRYDAIVSPANSYGFMDGAFDDAISIALIPSSKNFVFTTSGANENHSWTTKKVQTQLYQKHRGYAPPGSCTLIDVRRDADWHDIKRRAEHSDDDDGAAAVAQDGGEHPGGCKFIALCPTMRVPQNVQWDREVVFECIWSLLCTIDNHNRALADSELAINSILMTPLATGVGRVSEGKWAAQCVIAMKLWIEAVEKPEKWSNLQWNDVYPLSDMLEATEELAL